MGQYKDLTEPETAHEKSSGTQTTTTLRNTEMIVNNKQLVATSFKDCDRTKLKNFQESRSHALRDPGTRASLSLRLHWTVGSQVVWKHVRERRRSTFSML